MTPRDCGDGMSTAIPDSSVRSLGSVWPVNPDCPSALVSAYACYAERGSGFGSGFALTCRRRLSATTPLTLAEGAGRVSPSHLRRELAAHVERSSPLQLPQRWSAGPADPVDPLPLVGSRNRPSGRQGAEVKLTPSRGHPLDPVVAPQETIQILPALARTGYVLTDGVILARAQS